MPPKLSQLTDAYTLPDDLPVEQPFIVPTKADAITIRPVAADPRPEPLAEPLPQSVGILDDLGMAGSKDKSSKLTMDMLGKLFGLDGKERYQLWPEKVVREALAGAHDVMQTDPTSNLGLRREDVTDILAPSMPTNDSTWLGRTLNIAPVAAQPNDYMIDAAQAMSALAGSGGLAGADASLGAGPFLRPALKYENKIYKAPMNGQHLDALPSHLQDTFQKQAMSGEDISNFNFGFMNHKGQFLSREAALDYAIKEGLVDPHAAQYGTLTTTLLADSSKPGTAIEAMAKTNKPAFFSAVEHQVNQIAQPKMTGEQWLGTLANKPGVKPEELDWTGLRDFLQEKGKQPVTKQEVQDFVAANKVELKEVAKGSATPEVIKAAKDAFKEFEDYSEVLGEKYNLNPLQNLAMHSKIKKMEPSEVAKYTELQQRYLETKKASEVGDTKYHSYQLPGGENYREMLLTVPTEMNKYDTFIKELRAKYGEGGLANKPLTEAERIKLDKLQETAGDDGAKAYRSSHWEEPNILAHVRMNDRYFDNPNITKPKPLTDADFARLKELGTLIDKGLTKGTDVSALMKEQNEIGARIEGSKDKTFAPNEGKLKSLHLEEIQSDWHQQGRDKGYAIDQEKLQDKYDEIVKQQRQVAKDKSLENREANVAKFYELEKQRQEVEAQQRSAVHSVPDAPFKKSWHELALKRMIREAAEKGYDRLSWTPGEAQAARYDLSTHIDGLKVVPVDEGKVWWPQIKRGSGGSITTDNAGKITKANASWGDVVGKNISDVVGKEVANKGLNVKGETTLSGIDLKLGGEGMKGFYDQIIPKALEKIGKEHGVKVKTARAKVTDMPLSEYDKYPDGHPYKEKNYPLVRYIDIPQSLKDQAMHKGFPLFSGGYQFIPVAGNPFEDKK